MVLAHVTDACGPLAERQRRARDVRTVGNQPQASETMNSG
jgi:hypothetical protein